MIIWMKPAMDYTRLKETDILFALKIDVNCYDFLYDQHFGIIDSTPTFFVQSKGRNKSAWHSPE